MYPSTLTARSRAMWESLTGAPAGFGPVLDVAVSPKSRLGPPGWVGIVVIADAVIATAPAPGMVYAVQEALGMLHPVSLTDPAVLSTRLAIVDMLGPACLAYLDPAEFRPHHGTLAVEQLLPHDGDLRQLVAVSSAEDVAESGIAEIMSRPSPPASTERSSPPRATMTGRTSLPTSRCLPLPLPAAGAWPARSHQLPSRTRSHMTSSSSGERGQRHPGVSPGLLASGSSDSR